MLRSSQTLNAADVNGDGREDLLVLETATNLVLVFQNTGLGGFAAPLVFPSDADIDEGRLSVLAPLGTALLGARVGDLVEVNAPAGVRRIKVEKVLYQPEAAGDFHL